MSDDDATTKTESGEDQPSREDEIPEEENLQETENSDSEASSFSTVNEEEESPEETGKEEPQDYHSEATDNLQDEDVLLETPQAESEKDVQEEPFSDPEDISSPTSDTATEESIEVLAEPREEDSLTSESSSFDLSPELSKSGTAEDENSASESIQDVADDSFLTTGDSEELEEDNMVEEMLQDRDLSPSDSLQNIDELSEPEILEPKIEDETVQEATDGSDAEKSVEKESPWKAIQEKAEPQEEDFQKFDRPFEPEASERKAEKDDVSGEESLQEAEGETLPLESAEDETLPLESAKAETLPLESAEDETLPLESAKAETLPLESEEDETLPLESEEDETLPLESAEDETLLLESAEDETLPLESAEEDQQNDMIQVKEEPQAEDILTDDLQKVDQSSELGPEPTETIIEKQETSEDESLEEAEDEVLSIKSEEEEEPEDSVQVKEEPEEPLDDVLQKKSSQSSKPKDSARLRSVFARPRYAEPKHPIFSSLFARQIAKMAFGPKKPKWYTPLTSAQLYLFKDIMNYVEIGRQALFRFDDFLEALQDFEPSICRVEVLDILDNMEKNEFEELDFGKFLFLLAYRDHPLENDEPGDVDEKLSSPVVTPRQCLILSAISYYILIASPEDIERYYVSNTRRKATVLHYHMEAARLGSLTGKQMEARQKKAMLALGPLFALTGSPYALPVPFVRSLRKKQSKKNSKGKKPFSSETVENGSKPAAESKPDSEAKKRPLGKKAERKIFHDMHYGKIQLPIMNIPADKKAQMRKKCTVEHRDYICRKTTEAIKDYRKRLKEASLIYSRLSLNEILKKGFPKPSDKRTFIDTFQRYMPLRESDIQSFSLWVRPSGYIIKHNRKSPRADKYAFGSNIK